MQGRSDVRFVDVIIHNYDNEDIRDFLPQLVGNRASGQRNNPIDQQVEQQKDVVEVPSALLAPQPQLAPTSSQSTVSQEGIWQIFRDRDGRLTQERRELKATNKRDYIIRLAYLYMVARYRISDEKLPREGGFKIRDEA